MLQYLGHCKTFYWVWVEQTSDQSFGRLSDLILHAVPRFHDLLVQVLHVIRFEWYSSVKQSKQDDSSTPQISFEPFVPLVFNNFGSNISRCTALLFHDFTFLYCF